MRFLSVTCQYFYLHHSFHTVAMGKNRKPFIAKKNASTYHLLYRSQRDVAGDNEGGVVLWPSPGNKQETDQSVLGQQTKTMASWQDQLAEAGAVDDYDYQQHLKPITGSGDYLGSTGKREDGLLDPRSSALEDATINEVSRQLDSIALTPHCMDDDIAEALFGDFDEANFEEIADDFCLTAAEEPDVEASPEFDFDAHVRDLMERASKAKQDQDHVSLDDHDWGRQDREFFQRAKPVHAEDDDGFFVDSGASKLSSGVVPALDDDEERALCEKFEQTLAEYDSDDESETEDVGPEPAGELEMTAGQRALEAALNDFLEEKDDEVFMQGTRHLQSFQDKKGSGFHTLPQADDDGAKDTLQEIDFLQVPEEKALPPEEILIDGKSYFAERMQNPWDCESILTTYSNLDNNPVMVDSRRRRNRGTRKKQPHSQLAEGQPAQIHLSGKNGMPLGVLQTRPPPLSDFDLDTMASVNKGEKRSKAETKSEKKARKQELKLNRKVARLQKKMMKDAFREQAALTYVDGTATSVFKY